MVAKQEEAEPTARKQQPPASCVPSLVAALKDRIPEAIHRRNKVVGHSVVPLAEMGACLVAGWKMKCIRLLELRRS